MEPEDAKCPNCGQPASYVQMTGWLFYCVPCSIGWEHPMGSEKRNEACAALVSLRDSLEKVKS